MSRPIATVPSRPEPAPSSSPVGHRPFKAVTRVQIPLGSPRGGGEGVSASSHSARSVLTDTASPRDPRIHTLGATSWRNGGEAAVSPSACRANEEKTRPEEGAKTKTKTKTKTKQGKIFEVRRRASPGTEARRHARLAVSFRTQLQPGANRCAFAPRLAILASHPMAPRRARSRAGRRVASQCCSRGVTSFERGAGGRCGAEWVDARRASPKSGPAGPNEGRSTKQTPARRHIVRNQGIAERGGGRRCRLVGGVGRGCLVRGGGRGGGRGSGGRDGWSRGGGR